MILNPRGARCCRLTTDFLLAKCILITCLHREVRHLFVEVPNVCSYFWHQVSPVGSWTSRFIYFAVCSYHNALKGLRSETIVYSARSFILAREMEVNTSEHH